MPGFDISGEVEWAGVQSGFVAGDRVFGATFFGGYSTRCLVPGHQLLRVPTGLGMAEAAAVPSVAVTALHTCCLAGFWPHAPPTESRAALIHSAARGVGSMLVQMCKLCGFSPVVAVVGSSHKVSTCKDLGADVVIDKSKERLWRAAEASAPNGFTAIFDGNGVATLGEGYEHLAMTGRLVSYGFHSNLPSTVGALNPFCWLRMAFGMARMPKFDSMRMVLESKGLLGFNLSFFAYEHRLQKKYLEQLLEWLSAGKLTVSKVTEFDMSQVGSAHSLIQSGRSIGKIVLRTPCAEVRPQS